MLTESYLYNLSVNQDILFITDTNKHTDFLFGRDLLKSIPWFNKTTTIKTLKNPEKIYNYYHSSL